MPETTRDLKSTRAPPVVAELLRGDAKRRDDYQERTPARDNRNEGEA